MREQRYRELSATNRFSREAFNLGERTGYRCSYCRRDMLSHVDTYYRLWEHDHIVPSAAGGEDTEANKTLCCMPCNRIKGSWNPQSRAGTDASREELIKAVQEYVHTYRALWLEELCRVRQIIRREGCPDSEAVPAS